MRLTPKRKREFPLHPCLFAIQNILRMVCNRHNSKTNEGRGDSWSYHGVKMKERSAASWQCGGGGGILAGYFLLNRHPMCYINTHTHTQKHGKALPTSKCSVSLLAFMHTLRVGLITGLNLFIWFVSFVAEKSVSQDIVYICTYCKSPLWSHCLD